MRSMCAFLGLSLCELSVLKFAFERIKTSTAVLTVVLFLFSFTVYSLDGLLVVALLVVCTCAYITKVPRLKSFFLSEKKGFFGVFYKGNLL